MAERPHELGDFKGWVTLRLNFRLKGYVSANNYEPLDREWLNYNFAPGSFHTMKLCSRLCSIGFKCYSKTTKIVFEPAVGDLGVTNALQL